MAACFLVSAARAEPPYARLRCTRPVGSLCPTAQVLERDVEELVGRRLLSGDAQDADISVHVEMEELTSGARARLEVRTAEGTAMGIRELSAPTGECASLRRPIALVLAMLLERDHRPTPPAKKRGPRLSGGLSLSALTGALPRVTPGAGLAFVLDFPRRLQLGLHALYWLPVSIETQQGLGARFQAVSAAPAVCPRLFGREENFGLFFCGGVQLGALLSSPRKLDGPRLVKRPLAEAFLTIKGSLRIGGKCLLEVAVGPTFALSRPRFFLTRADGSLLDVHRPAQLGAIFHLTLIIPGP